MEVYKKRHISFKELVLIEDWKLKVYCIFKTQDVISTPFYNRVLEQIPLWLKLKNKFNDSHNNHAFLIIHKGTEGLFCLINWWVGDNMMNSHIFLAESESSTVFKKISGEGLSPCIWEFEIINHERVAWTNHVLKKAPSPDYQAYIKSVISGSF